MYSEILIEITAYSFAHLYKSVTQKKQKLPTNERMDKNYKPYQQSTSLILNSQLLKSNHPSDYGIYLQRQSGKL